MIQNMNAINTNDELLGKIDTACKDSPAALTTSNNTHILDFLDERIFPFKDHKEQLSTFFRGWPLVNVVNHTRLGTEER